MPSTRFRITSDDIWHQRLGHPHMRVVHSLKKRQLIFSRTSFNKAATICDSCQMAKACRLPFLNSNNHCDAPFSVIHCDLWGAAPVLSYQNFRYYAIFIDGCTRYTCFFPLKFNSDFMKCFQDFHKYVDNQFARKIKIFQSDGGGEFIGRQFQQYLLDHGIKHRLSCPHTPEQNDMAERKYCNITELRLTMLYHGSIPRRFWVEAFGTAVWLINRQPSQMLEWDSPYHKLFGKHPDYSLSI